MLTLQNSVTVSAPTKSYNVDPKFIKQTAKDLSSPYIGSFGPSKVIVSNAIFDPSIGIDMRIIPNNSNPSSNGAEEWKRVIDAYYHDLYSFKMRDFYNDVFPNLYEVTHKDEEPVNKNEFDIEKSFLKDGKKIDWEKIKNCSELDGFVGSIAKLLLLARESGFKENSKRF